MRYLAYNLDYGFLIFRRKFIKIFYVMRDIFYTRLLSWLKLSAGGWLVDSFFAP